jgi:hypothetical protein
MHGGAAIEQAIRAIRGMRSSTKKRASYRQIIIGMVATACLAGIDAQDGHFGQGHGTWHHDFYSKLHRNDELTSCCNDGDCRPTQSRRVGDRHEVKVDGEWTPVPPNKIVDVIAPDGGAHVCAPVQAGWSKGSLYCVVLPPDS